MDMKLYTDFLLSKEIELKECEADLLRIVGRLHQAGIRVELPTPKRKISTLVKRHE